MNARGNSQQTTEGGLPRIVLQLSVPIIFGVLQGILSFYLSQLYNDVHQLYEQVQEIHRTQRELATTQAAHRERMNAKDKQCAERDKQMEDKLQALEALMNQRFSAVESAVATRSADRFKGEDWTRERHVLDIQLARAEETNSTQHTFIWQELNRLAAQVKELHDYLFKN